MLVSGVRKSGKTYWVLSLVNAALRGGWYDIIYVCAPAIVSEMDGAYGFMCSRDECVIIPEFYDGLADVILKERQEAMRPVEKARTEEERARIFAKCPRALVIFDDATDYARKLTTSAAYTSLQIKTRHLKTTIVCITHGLRGVMGTIARSNTDYIALGNQIDGRSLEAFYDEYLKMIPAAAGGGARWPKLIDFMAEFLANVRQGRLLLCDLPGRTVMYTDEQPEVAALTRALADPKDSIMHPPTQFADLQKVIRAMSRAGPPAAASRPAARRGPDTALPPPVDFRAAAIARLRGRYGGLTRAHRNLQARDTSSESD